MPYHFSINYHRAEYKDYLHKPRDYWETWVYHGDCPWDCPG